MRQMQINKHAYIHKKYRTTKQYNILLIEIPKYINIICLSINVYVVY